MQYKSENWITFGLIVLALIARIIPHPANFSPLIALALFAGQRWSWRRSFFVMGFILLASNLFLGADAVVWATTGIFFLLTGAAKCLPANHSWQTSTILAFITSWAFFLASNFFVWALADWYPPTLGGLLDCFTLALPFYPASFFSTLIYSLVLWHIVARRSPFPSTGRVMV